MHRRLPAIGVLLMVLTGLACQSAPPPPVTAVALVDLSGSLPPETVAFYAETIAGGILKQLSPADRLAVLPIDAGAESRSEPLYTVDLSTVDFTAKGDGVARAAERRQARIDAFLAEQEVLVREAVSRAAAARRALSAETDILGALHVAAARLSGNDRTRRVLVVFADLSQESRELDIRRLAREGEAGVPALVDGVRAAGRLPALADTDALIIGAGETGTRQGDNAAYFRAVRLFWARLLEASGARLDAERHYGYRTQDQLPALLRAPQP